GAGAGREAWTGSAPAAGKRGGTARVRSGQGTARGAAGAQEAHRVLCGVGVVALSTTEKGALTKIVGAPSLLQRLSAAMPAATRTQVVNEVPQPQELLAFGLENW